MNRKTKTALVVAVVAVIVVIGVENIPSSPFKNSPPPTTSKANAQAPTPKAPPLRIQPATIAAQSSSLPPIVTLTPAPPNYKNQAELDAQIDTAKKFVTSGVATPMMVYKLNTGSFPTTEEGLVALVEQPANAPNWRGPYLVNPQIPLDPWGRPYQYAYPGSHSGSTQPDMWSFGPDGNDTNGDLINNWSN